jgi:hypothetical protein
MPVVGRLGDTGVLDLLNVHTTAALSISPRAINAAPVSQRSSRQQDANDIGVKTFSNRANMSAPTYSKGGGAVTPAVSRASPGLNVLSCTIT